MAFEWLKNFHHATEKPPDYAEKTLAAYRLGMRGKGSIAGVVVEPAEDCCEAARELAGKVSDAWINFARKGDPNHPGLPNWPAYSADPGPVMVFDKACEVKNDPDREVRKAVASALS